MENLSMNKLPIPKEKLYKGMRYFSILTVLGLGILFYATTTGETIEALSHLQFRFFLLAAFLQAIDIILGAWRNHLLLQKLKPGVKLSLCLRAQLANEFAAAVTPGQSGGGPAWLYVLYRGGISFAPAIAVRIIVFLSTLFFFEIATVMSAFILNDLYTGNTFIHMLNIGLAVCSGIILIVGLSIMMPERVCYFLKSYTQRFQNSQKRWQKHVTLICQHFIKTLNEFQQNCKLLFRKYPVSVFNVFLITCVYFFVKLNLAYVILLGMGIQLDYMTALAIFSLLRFILYFTPTPGGSGVGEISIAALMSAFMPTPLLPLYTIIYRAFHLFLPAAFGGWVLLSELKSGATKTVGEGSDSLSKNVLSNHVTS